MQIFETREALQQALAPLREQRRVIGLVPTMGNLHDGHLALVAAARQHSAYVVATIFVNPLQFGANEDLANYPRTLQDDTAKLAAAGCDALFVPPVPVMYPHGVTGQTLVTVPGLSERHCGASRPGHFAGVCTVVCKLFNLVRPDVAVFGEKDYQQLQIIRKMTMDLCLPVKIISVPTVRDKNGLALSSRNGYLDARQLETAANLQRCLRQAAAQLQQGQTVIAALENAAIAQLEAAGMRPDYFHICHATSLEPATAHDRQLVILAAAWLGNTRLIDNIRVDIDR